MKLIVDIPEEDINKIKKIRFLIGGKEDRLLQQSIINAIKNAVPERERGEWEVDEDGNVTCPFCGMSGYGNFCSNCGADMRKDKE